MNNIVLLIQCGDRGNKWIPYFLHYYNKNWICDDFIDTVFLFETTIPEIKSDKKNIHIETMGKVPWGQGMIEYLKRCPYEYVILIHEDYFLTKEQNIDKLKELIYFVEKYHISLLKICGDWAGYTSDKKSPLTGITERYNIYMYEKSGQYIISHQVSIWSTRFLLDSIEPTDNPWAHEMTGSKRVAQFSDIVLAYLGEQPIPYSESVTAGAPRPTCKHFFEVEL